MLIKILRYTNFANQEGNRLQRPNS